MNLFRRHKMPFNDRMHGRMRKARDRVSIAATEAHERVSDSWYGERSGRMSYREKEEIYAHYLMVFNAYIKLSRYVLCFSANSTEINKYMEMFYER